MDVVVFVAVAVALYFFCDWVLDRLERAAGRRFEYRSVIFFGLLLGLALLSFALIRRFTELI